MFVLSQNRESFEKPPLLIGFDGNVINLLHESTLCEIFVSESIESNLDFEFETENQVYYSCIATLFGNFYVLGGSSQNGRQVIL